MFGRNHIHLNYSYGFNGMEKDDEVNGGGNSYNFSGRSLYDGRLARFVSSDPDENKYVWQSTYAYSGNSPIYLKDKEGRGYIFTIYSPYVSAKLRSLSADELTLEHIMSVLETMKAEFPDEDIAWVQQQLSGVNLPNGNKTSSSEFDGDLESGKIVFVVLNEHGALDALTSFDENIPALKDVEKDFGDMVSEMWDDFVGAVEDLEKSKTREATAFERWCWEHTDGQGVSDMIDAFLATSTRKAGGKASGKGADVPSGRGNGNFLTGLGKRGSKIPFKNWGRETKPKKPKVVCEAGGHSDSTSIDDAHGKGTYNNLVEEAQKK